MNSFRIFSMVPLLPFIQYYTCLFTFFGLSSVAISKKINHTFPLRERISINEKWKFMWYNYGADNLIYDERPLVINHTDNSAANTRAIDSALAAAIEIYGL